MSLKMENDLLTSTLAKGTSVFSLSSSSHLTLFSEFCILNRTKNVLCGWFLCFLPLKQWCQMKFLKGTDFGTKCEKTRWFNLTHRAHGQSDQTISVSKCHSKPGKHKIGRQMGFIAFLCGNFLRHLAKTPFLVTLLTVSWCVEDIPSTREALTPPTTEREDRKIQKWKHTTYLSRKKESVNLFIFTYIL